MIAGIPVMKSRSIIGEKGTKFMEYTNPYYGASQAYQQPYGYRQQYQPTMQQPQNTFSWVQGEAGAKAFYVAAGNSVLLMDSENPVIYMKSTDNSGRPLPMKTYDLIERQGDTAAKQDVDFGAFVKRDELADVIAA